MHVIFTFSIQAKADLYDIRTIPGLMIAQEEDKLWVKTFQNQSEIPAQLWGLKASAVYLLDENQYLFRINEITPVAQLPDLDWQPLPSFLSVESPISAFPGKIEEKVEIKLQPYPTLKPGQGLLTDLSTWNTYGEAASEVRLNRLSFAVSSQGEVMILGTPLPSIPGKEYWQMGRLLIPAGYHFAFPMLAQSIEKKLLQGQDAYIVFYPEGNWTLIPQNQLVKGSRSAIRITHKNYGHG